MVPDGVGEDRGVPILGSITYVLYPGTELSGLLGVNLNGRIEMEDKSGGTLYRAEYDQSVFSGITFRARF